MFKYFSKSTIVPLITFLQPTPASLRVPGVDSDDETKTPSPSPHHGRSRPPSLIADSSSESDEGDARGEVRPFKKYRLDKTRFIRNIISSVMHRENIFVC